MNLSGRRRARAETAKAAQGFGFCTRPLLTVRRSLRRD